MRTMKASARTPKASDRPIDLTIGSLSRTKPPKTPIMISAAATTTRALWPKPVTIASRGLAPWTKASRIRETRNTS